METADPRGVFDARDLCLIRTVVNLRRVTCVRISTGSSKAKLPNRMQKMEACQDFVWILQRLTVDLGSSPCYYRGTSCPTLSEF